MSNLDNDPAARVSDKDPILRRPSSPAWTEIEFVEFFEEREFPDSPTEGFLAVAKSLIDDLHTMQQHMDAVSAQTEYDLPMSPMVIPLVTKPFDSRRVSKNDAAKLYVHEESPATKALRGRLEYMLKAKLLGTGRNKDDTLVYYATRYVGPVSHDPMTPYLIERRGRDEGGYFSQLFLKSLLGPDILSRFGSPFRAAAEGDFFTTAQIEREILDLYKSTLGEIPTADIDEADLVRRYFDRTA